MELVCVNSSCIVPSYCFEQPNESGLKYMTSLHYIGTDQLGKMSDLIITMCGLKSDASA